MAVSTPVENQIEPSAVTDASQKGRRLRKLATRAGLSLLVLTLVLLAWPVARVSRETAQRIVPGMTVNQAMAIVGAPPDWYDGVVALQCNSPVEKSYWHEWVGAAGSLILTPDTRGNVATANFYPAITVQQSPWNFVLERMTRRTRSQWERWWMHGNRA